MTATDISTAAPGSRFLIACDAQELEGMVETICEAASTALKAKAALNACVVTSMDMTPDDSPNRFSDLVSLCGKLVAAAGHRSHFEGLLLLNIAPLISFPDNTIRLKALGEWLCIPKGLASRCITLLYGPANERDLLACADLLDFDGKLRVGHYDLPVRHLLLSELLASSALQCATPEAEQLLENAINDMKPYQNFSPCKFLKTCGNTFGFITARAISDALQDPFSYINRIRKASDRADQTSGRRIGFQTSR
ncbi:MAG: hypothetical protein ACI4O7_02485 [Aristaeellaceae bacterium]